MSHGDGGMTPEHHSDVLAALLRIEHARLPVTDRSALPAVLAGIAEELRGVIGAHAIRIAVAAAAFDPPLHVTALSPPGEQPLHGCIDYPLVWGGLCLGTLSITPRPVGAEAALALLSRAATETIAEVRAAELLVLDAEQRVRRWLANELHDAVKQTLPAIRLLAERAARETDANPRRARRLLDDIRESAQQGLEELTLLLGGMRGQPAGVNLHHMLSRLLAQVAREDPHLHVESRIDIAELPWDVAACVLGIVRNALTNVVRHAQAKHVAVQVAAHNDRLTIDVRDDGIGLQREQALAEPGIGLDSMFERVTELGGSVELASRPGGGTSIRVRLPLRAGGKHD